MPLLCAACAPPGTGEKEDKIGEASAAVVVCHPDTVEGVDVSEFQASINWGAVRNGGYHDPTFATNWVGMKNAGVKRGVYQFFEPGEDPSAQADIVLQAIGGGPLGDGDLPAMLDVEVTGGQSGATITAHIHTWIDKIQAATGRVPVIYTGKYFWNDNVGSGDFAGLPLWIAAYGPPCPDTPNAWNDWRLWQYADNGNIPGIGGAVDRDVFHGSSADLAAFASPPDKPPIGWLDAADCTSIRGWSQDPDSPTAPIATHVYFNGGAGQPGAIGIPLVADQHRDDLCAAIGSCDHGYSMSTPLSLMDGMDHVVHTYGIDSMGGANPELSGSPKTIHCDPPTPPVTPPGGIKRWIPSPDVLNAWKFSTFLSLLHLPDASVAAYPKGPDLPMTPEIVQADDGTPEVWVIDTGIRRHVIDPTSFAAWHFDAPGVLQKKPAAEVYGYPKGADFQPTPFMIQGSDAPVYVLDVPFQPPMPTGAGGAGSSSTGISGVGGSGTGGSGGGSANPSIGHGGCHCDVSGGSGDEGSLALSGLIGVAFVRLRRRRNAPGRAQRP